MMNLKGDSCPEMLRAFNEGIAFFQKVCSG